MIRRIDIQGLAIIDSLAIEFEKGFNVITGETGTGKSILIKALHFLSGGRASQDWIRSGVERAVVCGTFEVEAGHAVLEQLDRLGIAVEDDQIIIRRQLTSKGRSQCWVNDVGVTSQSLKIIGPVLLDIFTQHENQRLMDSHNHLKYVDAFLATPDLVDVYRTQFDACSEKLHAIVQSLSQLEKTERDLDFLQYRLEELRGLSPNVEDYERLAELSQSGGSRLKTQQSLSSVVEVLNQSSMLQVMRRGAVEIRQFSKAWEPFCDRLQSLANEWDDLSFEAAQMESQVDVDESEIEASQTRLYQYQSLMRKHGVETVEALVEAQAKLDAQMELIERTKDTLLEWFGELKQFCVGLKKEAAKLSQARKQALAKIQKRVEKELSELAMPGVKFESEFEPISRALSSLNLEKYGDEVSKLWLDCAAVLGEHNEHGAERVEFLMAANPGEPVLPISKFASGGELSRILLALKKALVADADTCVLVFDEIDTGISGRVADVVGAKLKDLSREFQVLCISHLPQVAAYAQRHFRVVKHKVGDRTQSSVQLLSQKEHISEIARLLSGEKVTPSGLANARQLVEKASKKSSQPKSRASLSAPLM